MLAIYVELLHGTFRGDPDGTAHTGELRRGEWPPAPSRLLAAMVAADGTGERCRVTDGSELEWFEQLPAPVIHAHAKPWHQALHPRYAVEHKRSPQRSTHQEYLGRKSASVRPGVRVTPRHPHVVYAWRVEAPPDFVAALQRRAARIGYLGAADSPVRVRVGDRLPDSAASDDVFLPDPDGNTEMSVPAAGDVRILDAMYSQWVERGPSVARAQFPALRHQSAYRSPRVAQPRNGSGTVVAWLRLAPAISGRRIAKIAALFKRAVLKQYQIIHGEPPAVLHGHGFRTSGYELARFLALPDVGYQRSRGRLHGLALWLPPRCDPIERWRVRDATIAIRRLNGHGFDVAVMSHEHEARPFAANPERWCRPSRGWVTAVPAIHERRGALNLAEVSLWCAHAGLPAPTGFRSSRVPLIRGGVDLAPREVNRPGRPGLPYSHVHVWFKRPVPGPVVIGAGRQRGLGLCIPVDDRDGPDDV